MAPPITDFLAQASARQGSSVCFYAYIRDEPGDAVAASVRQDMDLSSMLPADSNSPEESPSIVIGSLDLTIGLSPDSWPGCNLMQKQ